MEIYYFSTTGNSLSAARMIAKRFTGTRLISIPSTRSLARICFESKTIGLVFPVYHATFGESGLPALVVDFIKRIENPSDFYIFAACTHSGYPGTTRENLNALLSARGGKLSASIDLRLGMPYSTRQKLAHLFFHRPLSVNPVKEQQQRMELEDRATDRIERLCRAIEQRSVVPFRRSSRLHRALTKSFLTLQKGFAIKRYRKLSGMKSADLRALIRRADRSFTVSSSCDGCGICAGVCPVENIELVASRPQWLGACIGCNACYQWCPQEAIDGKIVEFEKRYHNRGIELTDMLIK
ncbi:MAG: EFR1 family ferrodoxin [Acholeplasmataceae bacterium]